VLTPRAALEPVEINGVIVKNATLHNFGYIAEKDIRPGDRVLVKRAGEVIPYVIGPVVDLRTGWNYPTSRPRHVPPAGSRWSISRVKCLVLRQCRLPGPVGAQCGAFRLARRYGYQRVGHQDRGETDRDRRGQGCGRAIYPHPCGYFGGRYQKDRKTDKEPPGKIADNLLAAIQVSRNQPLSRLLTALG